MKKVLMNFSENVLSRSQMKVVKGGNEDTPGESGACCTVYCWAGDIELGHADIASCSNAGGYCTQHYPTRDRASCSCG